jgi:multidrug efflux pump subunit AcrB
VGNPTILATFAVIAAILPMAFVRGLMGPYMRPIPVGSSLAMLFSLGIAFIISPWAALKVFRKEADEEAHTPHTDAAKEDWSTRAYRRVMHALLAKSGVRSAFFLGVVGLLLGAMALVGLGAVKVKMLPFDNKSEFMVQLDLPAGTPKEASLALGQAAARRLMADPLVKDVQVYAGDAAPFTFVGMVRHAFLRQESEMVDLQVNLVDKAERKEQSHDVATRLRPELLKLVGPAGARMKIVEIPPGPPVMDTLVAEVYGPTQEARQATALQVRQAFLDVNGVVDVDSTLNATHPKLSVRLDREKAALHGVAPALVMQTLSAAGQGMPLGTFHVDRGATQVPVILQLPKAQRTRLDQLLQLTVPGQRGAVPLAELVTVDEGAEAPAIHHKNLMPLAYVFGDLAGAIESPVYALSALNKKLDALKNPDGTVMPRLGLSHPETTEKLAMKWDGEWHITLEVFRDLGLAFAAVLVLIYVLVVGWFDSFAVPLVILVPVPLSLIGILPAHALLGSFFTATSMIGFIAGAGIIVRNSIILVDFIELKLREGMALEAAVEEAGVVRFRPMLLTASAVLVGSSVMLKDPIFQGLALSLMAGEVAATLLSRLAVPVLYYLLARRGRAADLQREGLASAASE